MNFSPKKGGNEGILSFFFGLGDSGSLLDTRKKIGTKNMKKDVVRKKNKKQM